MTVMNKEVGQQNSIHWYQCPNGHVYTIGECGGAMQQSTCPECGAIIGGLSHALNSQNSVAHDFINQIERHQ